MFKGKVKLFIFLIFLVLLSSLNGSNALEYSKNMNGPLGIWFDLTIEIYDTELDSGEHDIYLAFIVADFSDGTSINSTVVKLSIRSSVEVYSTSVSLGNFTPAQASAFASTTFMYRDYWGDVTLYMKVQYIFQRDLYTSSHVLDTGWFSFVDLHPSVTEDPYEPTPWGLYIGLIVLGILALFGVIIFFTYRFYMRLSPKPVQQHRQKFEIMHTVKPEPEKQVTKAKPMPSEEMQILKEYCLYCGNKTETDARFCDKCGQTLKKK